MREYKKILITGGAGFIGSHLVTYFVNKYPQYDIYNLDNLTYAGNLHNLTAIANAPNYHFIKGDICNNEFIENLFNEHKFDSVLHLAAESHVDRSIGNPMEFIHTNIIGTVNLLNAAKSIWTNRGNHLFYHISTDEVYGSLNPSEYFKESTAYDPQSPYSASKASSDHFVRAYHNTYRLPSIISNCSNNYGPYQFPEKLIPLFIQNIIDQKALPVYGNGKNERDWLYVGDHIDAIDTIFHKGTIGETYNIGGSNEMQNIDMVHKICETMDDKLNRKKGDSVQLISYVKDRAGHDMRYAVDTSKIENELGWTAKTSFEEGLANTIDWYLANITWLKDIQSGAYRSVQ